MNEILSFSLRFMVEKGKLVLIELMVSVQSWTVFEFYGDYWHAHPDQFPDESALHPTVKDKDGSPMSVKDIHTRGHW